MDLNQKLKLSKNYIRNKLKSFMSFKSLLSFKLSLPYFFSIFLVLFSLITIGYHTKANPSEKYRNITNANNTSFDESLVPVNTFEMPFLGNNISEKSFSSVDSSQNKKKSVIKTHKNSFIPNDNKPLRFIKHQKPFFQDPEYLMAYNTLIRTSDKSKIRKIRTRHVRNIQSEFALSKLFFDNYTLSKFLIEMRFLKIQFILDCNSPDTSKHPELNGFCIKKEDLSQSMKEKIKIKMNKCLKKTMIKDSWREEGIQALAELKTLLSDCIAVKFKDENKFKELVDKLLILELFTKFHDIYHNFNE